MGRYQKKPIIVEAEKWVNHGDHDAVEPFLGELFEGRCIHCGTPAKVHGMVKTLEGDMLVCPGDYVITGVEGEHYPCKPNIFRQTYIKVAEDV